jgi:hypothetical protein
LGRDRCGKLRKRRLIKLAPWLIGAWGDIADGDFKRPSWTSIDLLCVVCGGLTVEESSASRPLPSRDLLIFLSL